MKRLAVALLLSAGAWPAATVTALRTVPAHATVNGARATQQFLAIAQYSDGTERDVTAEVQWRVSNPELVRMVSAGRVAPSTDGQGKITAVLSGKQAHSSVKVVAANAVRPVSFVNEISGILTKRGCNGAACHGGVKGQGGLKLSPGDLYPADDYEWIVKGGTYQVLTAEVKGERIPRIDLANPEKSLLLTKPTMTAPHGGGKRFEATSDDYNTILQWIRNGAPYDDGAGSKRPALTRLEIYPPTAVMQDGGHHRLLVTAHYADGHSEDYTHQVVYTSNDAEIASVSADGFVTAKRRGETAILVRAAGQVASVGVGVTGPAIANYPAIARSNFIDEHVFDKLRRFQIIPSELSSDSEFLRRVCLDLTGTLPPPARAREFLASKDPQKRAKVIDALIASPEFVDYWTFRFAEIFRCHIRKRPLTEVEQGVLGVDSRERRDEPAVR